MEDLDPTQLVNTNDWSKKHIYTFYSLLSIGLLLYFLVLAQTIYNIVKYRSFST